MNGKRTGRASLGATWVAAFASVFSGLLGSAQAQGTGEVVTVVDPIDIPPENDPLAHAWDRPGERGGVYLRLAASLGVENTRIGPPAWDSDIEGISVTGFTSAYALDFGGFVRPWLALHLDANVGVLWNGDIEELRVLGETAEKARIATYGLAPAVTFFTPRHFYFKPAFGVGFATLRWPGTKEKTDPGFYMNLVAGKDLYVAPNFSVGLQFEIAYFLLGHDEEYLETRIRQFLFGVSFGFNGGG